MIFSSIFFNKYEVKISFPKKSFPFIIVISISDGIEVVTVRVLQNLGQY